MVHDADRLGEIDEVDDGCELRFVRPLEHPVDRVWRAITEPEHLSAWFPGRIVGTFELGAKLKFVDSHPGIDDFDGEILRYEVPHLLELRWATDTIRFEIEETSTGCTIILTVKISELGKASRDGAGWHVCLDALVAEIDGVDKKWTTPEHWAEVHPLYVDRFGEAASVIGPPGGET